MDTWPAVSSSIRYSEKELLSFLLEKAQKGESPLAVWRLPGSTATHLVLSANHSRPGRETPVEDLDPGFLMAPFEKNSQRFFLPADKFFTFENGTLKTDTPLEQSSAQWLSEQLPPRYTSRPFIPQRATAPAPKDQQKQAFVDIIEKAIEEIQRGTFEKIVPSRTRTLRIPESFDVVESFQKLCRNYPGALISFVRIPGVGSWLGASPEILVCVQNKSIFKTVALAGTLPYKPDVDLRSVAWTQKEIEEQALVERYVISCFKKIRLREYEEHGPKTIVAGNLMHLKSEFTVDMKATNFAQLGSVMLDLLHPTSAVCGMPLEASLAFLKQHEKHDRGFYAGYLGPVNVHNNIDLFVNLRCMQMSGSEGILYAGAGVTADSVPEKEWQETEMKFDTLLKVIL
jgi:isochorismate synthase